VLLDLMMPGALDGLGTLEKLRERRPDVPVVMMSGRAGLTDAVRATGSARSLPREAAHPRGVLLALASAFELRQARREAARCARTSGSPAPMVGDSAGAAGRARADRARGPTDARVLITGESGTGKELVAAAIHWPARARDKPFVRVNCAAIPRDLVESEMFGHERGAFTGATERRIGRFELAHTGTLFLDEVGDLGAEAQAKLLRAIEAREIERVGGGKPIRSTCASSPPPTRTSTRAVADGSFREDLFFRLNVIPMQLPPLRERPGTCRRWCGTSAPGTARARDSRWYRGATRHCGADRVPWPGNVRELAERGGAAGHPARRQRGHPRRCAAGHPCGSPRSGAGRNNARARKRGDRPRRRRPAAERGTRCLRAPADLGGAGEQRRQCRRGGAAAADRSPESVPSHAAAGVGERGGVTALARRRFSDVGAPGFLFRGLPI
jgi:two-component system, NtrC family, nitrogen regulation response regulator NtrX